MPLPEANFFGIVVAIQQKSGGNLSEALGNLSKVLRDRKKMAEKIQAMSTEAKASAGIIGSLPPIVMLLVWISTARLHRAALDPSHRSVHAGVLRRLDDARRPGDEENDQFRLLTVRP
jgi:Flp pilus assembly protein TadB